jgi:hypothetical protein
LGHVVSAEGLRKQPEFIAKVDALPRPSTVGELRSFLGLINFQRKFVEGASTIQKPLSCLTGGRGSSKIVWTPECVTAFDKLKELMKQDIVLSFPDYRKEASPLELWVDASSMGAGACLRQVQDNHSKVICYASMTFEGSQINYSTLDKELAALRWGVRTFRTFL